jgi:hypothetical protein
MSNKACNVSSRIGNAVGWLFSSNSFIQFICIVLFITDFNYKAFSANESSLSVTIIPKTGNCSRCLLESRQLIDRLLRFNKKQIVTVIIPSHQRLFYQRNYLSKLSLGENQFDLVENDSIYNIYSMYPTDYFIIKSNDSVIFASDKITDVYFNVTKSVFEIKPGQKNYEYFVNSKFLGSLLDDNEYYFFNRAENLIYKYNPEQDSVTSSFYLKSIRLEELSKFYRSDSLGLIYFKEDLGPYVDMLNLYNVKIINNKMYATVSFSYSLERNDTNFVYKFVKILVLDEKLNVQSSRYIEYKNNLPISLSLDFSVNEVSKLFIFNANDDELKINIPVLYKVEGDSLVFHSRIVYPKLVSTSRKLAEGRRGFNFDFINNDFIINYIWLPVYFNNSNEVKVSLLGNSYENNVNKTLSAKGKYPIYTNFASNYPKKLMFIRKDNNFVLYNFKDNKIIHTFIYEKYSKAYFRENKLSVFSETSNIYKCFELYMFD